MCDLTARISNLPREEMQKIHLLAASAGTGKTYSIQTIYLRLVLVEKLIVQQILTVTFTKDATKELRDRLQKVLRGALDYLDGAIEITDKNDRTKMLVDAARGENCDNDADVRQRLQLALLDFDMAAIYTIHGFCQRVLKRFAFETGQAFDVESDGDTSDEIEQLCKDWWRKNMYSMDEKVVGFLSKSGKFSLEIITRLAKKIIAKPDAKLLPEVEVSQRVDEAIKSLLSNFQMQKIENDDFAGKPESIRKAIQTVQAELEDFKAYVSKEEWGKAIFALQTVMQKELKVDNPCKESAEALKSACNEFKEKRPGANAKNFTIDENGCLIHKTKPEPNPENSNNIKTALQRLKNIIDSCSPYEVVNIRSGKPVKAFQGVELLFRHFFPDHNGQHELSADPKTLLDAITKIANDGTGITDQVKITVDAINPAFRRLSESLIVECVCAACRAALEVKEKYRESRHAAMSVSYDDYLVNLRDALAKPDSGLVATLQNEFKAALIDEFQDTDPIQWGIFEKLFKDSAIPCFLVGDSKQAIYRFRNGDVETYQNATNGLKTRYPLKKNYRSEKRLIDAVNQVFMDDNDRKTFGEGIEYKEPLDAAGKDQDKSLLVAGEPDQNPFKIILIPNNSSSKLPGKNSNSAKLAYKLTAQEIAKFLNDDSLKIGGRQVSRKDIAVLVNKHDHAEYITKELKNLNIPAVRQGTGYVWKTDEGRVMWAVLDAVLDSRDMSKVKRALITAWCGLTLEQIQSLNEGIKLKVGCKDYGLADWAAVFEDLHETWMKRGFPAMFRKMMEVFDVKKRLLSADDRQGQRRLTNINHLSELIEKKIIEDRKTPEGVLAGIRRQFDKNTADGGEEMNLRLETDDDAVMIQTIFTSKGLEYPIVFAPTLLMMKVNQREGIYEFHDEDGNLNVARKQDKEFGSEAKKKSDDAQKIELKEMEREHVRQIYVALTRAVHRTVVVALNDGIKDGNAKKNEVQKYKMMGVLGDVLRLPMKMVKENDKESIVVDLEKVSERFSNIHDVDCAIEVKKAAELSSVEPIKTIPFEISPPPEKPKADTSKGHGSFSSLAPREKKKGDETGVGIMPEEKNRDGETSEQTDVPPVEKPSGIFAFPAGAKTGTCWHEIFEDLAFIADDDAIRLMAEEKLSIHGFLKNKDKQEERINLTYEMVKNVLQTPMPQFNGTEAFALKSIPPEDIKTEWEFSFSSLIGKKTSELKEAVSAYDQYKPFIDDLSEWDRDIPGGYLTGFVDLLCRKNNHYYIVDWKSNRCNGVQEGFNQSGLREEISYHRYWLQYLIYSVAAHQYLSKAMDGYNYAEHFGGVYYIFLRGVDGGKDENGNVNGIYADLPPENLIQELSNMLGAFS